MIRAIFILVFLSNSAIGQDIPWPYKYAMELMGVHFEITAVAFKKEQAEQAVSTARNEITRIEKLISSWDENSQTSKINQYSGIRPIKVDLELFDLIKRCLKISKKTKGAFDISFASIQSIWRFDESMTSLPHPDSIAKSVQFINYKNIVLNDADTTVYLKEKGMKIGFGAIGKGYAAERAKTKMQSLGIASGLINAGGDIIAWGQKMPNQLWTIGIANPDDLESSLATISLKNKAVVTSGNAVKFVQFSEIRYSHIIDPRTGWPAAGLKNVTIICEDGALADALATAIFVLGKRKGLRLAKRQKGVACFMIDEYNKIFKTKNFPYENSRRK